MTTIPNETAQKLRQHAEELFRASENLIPELTSPEETKRLFHELQLSQIELEMQNEELRLAHEDLDASQSRYFDLYDLAPVGYLTIDESGLIKEVNLAAVSMLGVARNMLIKKPLNRIIFTDDQDMYSLRQQQSRNSTAQNTCELRLVRADGSPLWVHLQLTTAQNGESWITFADISDRKQREAVLEARLRLMHSAASQTLDELLRATLDEAEALTGSQISFYLFLAPDQVTLSLQAWSTNTARTMHKVEGAQRHHQFKQAGVWAEAINLRRAVIHNDYASLPNRKGLPEGHLPVIRELLVPIVRGDKIVALIGVGNKLTEYNEQDIAMVMTLADQAWEFAEKKQAETELQEREEKYRAIIDAIDGDIYICSKEYRIEFLNNKLIRHLGRNATGELCYKALHDSDSICEWCDAAQVFAGKSVSWELKNPKDERWYEVHNSPIYNGDGTVSMQTLITDITEKKSVMAQLLHAQKMESIGQLAGGLAHDLNNILTIVNGYGTLAQHGMDREQKQFRYLDEVIRATSRAASLTHSLMAYSRKQEMNQQRQNLNLLITTVGSFISRIIHDNITFTLSLAAEPLGVNVDTVQIEQVLLNLATNARDAMPDGGTFTIATAAGSMDERFIATHGYGSVGRYAIITATDSGHGMNAETKRKVFDPFFTTKEVDKGTGLGLAMVMGIIKQHGGFIDLQSEPGRGSVFQLYLPLVDMGESAAETAVLHLQMEIGSGTILLAEDDEDTRNAVAEFLTRAGYTVISAIDGQDAVEKFAADSGKIDLVISDVVMPRKSGKTACDEIRQMSENVKFIFVSGHADVVMKREGELGTDVEIIAKPILPYELLKSVRALMPAGSDHNARCET
jgi:PAS domain S-box-containing protein